MRPPTGTTRFERPASTARRLAEASSSRNARPVLPGGARARPGGRGYPNCLERARRAPSWPLLRRLSGRSPMRRVDSVAKGPGKGPEEEDGRWCTPRSPGIPTMRIS